MQLKAITTTSAINHFRHIYISSNLWMGILSRNFVSKPSICCWACHDGISAAMVKHCLPLNKSQLLPVFNACLILCFFPVQGKTSKVTIIGKLHKQSYNDLQVLGLLVLHVPSSNVFKKLFWIASCGSPELKSGSVPTNMDLKKRLRKKSLRRLLDMHVSRILNPVLMNRKFLPVHYSWISKVLLIPPDIRSHHLCSFKTILHTLSHQNRAQLSCIQEGPLNNSRC